MQQIARFRCHDGWLEYHRHSAESVHSDMTFAVFLPPVCEHTSAPVLYWLSGLTCNHENFVQKAGALKLAAELGVVVVAPDTSPRDTGIPGEDTDWDFGTGAGFYVDATQSPWDKHYQMYSYVACELPELVAKSFPVTAKKSISGHSMGGHGALTVALKNPDQYQSVSAFAPISAPMSCPWGHKNLGGYLGDNHEDWTAYDATQLIKNLESESKARSLHFLVDQGEDDQFLEEQLKPHLLEEAAQTVGLHLELRMQPGYDHSYFFVASFIEDHLRFHHHFLTAD